MKREDSGHVARWAGLAAFCGSAVGAKILVLVSSSDWLQLLAALGTSVLIGLGVFCREKLVEAREQRHSE